jgi:hypothetical protein
VSTDRAALDERLAQALARALVREALREDLTQETDAGARCAVETRDDDGIQLPCATQADFGAA